MKWSNVEDKKIKNQDKLLSNNLSLNILYESINQKINYHVSNCLQDTFDYSQENKKRNEFRVSSFPYCNIIDLKYDNEIEIESYHEGFYTSVGTGVHENMQYFKSLTKRYGNTFIGGWKCINCGAEWGNKKPVTKPLLEKQKLKCKKDNCSQKTLRYKEIEFNYKGLSGHLDNINIIKKDNIIIAWEYKTCGNKYIENEFYHKFLPFKKHIHQIETYCTLLKILYNIDVNAYVITYLSRDQPFDKNKIRSNICIFDFTYDKYVHRKSKILNAINGRKAKLNFLKNKKYINEMIETKPCKRPIDYRMNGMDDKFFANSKCPLYSNGKCFNTPILKRILLKERKKFLTNNN